jgi:hypothetical protein
MFNPKKHFRLPPPKNFFFTGWHREQIVFLSIMVWMAFCGFDGRPMVNGLWHNAAMQDGEISEVKIKNQAEHLGWKIKLSTSNNSLGRAKSADQETDSALRILAWFFPDLLAS